MTAPPNPPDDDEADSIVEIDAMDEDDWDKDQHTPTVNNDTLARLVKESVTIPAPEPVSSPAIALPRTTSRNTVTNVKPRAQTSPGIGPASPTSPASPTESGPTKVPR